MRARSRTFATWLKAELDAREWTQADFARRIAGTDARVSEWASARRLPSPPTCARIADALGLDLDVVLAAAGHRAIPCAPDPDDPRQALHGLVDQIVWTDDRLAAAGGLLRALRDRDRRC